MGCYPHISIIVVGAMAPELSDLTDQWYYP